MFLNRHKPQDLAQLLAGYGPRFPVLERSWWRGWCLGTPVYRVKFLRLKTAVSSSRFERRGCWLRLQGPCFSRIITRKIIWMFHVKQCLIIVHKKDSCSLHKKRAYYSCLFFILPRSENEEKKTGKALRLILPFRKKDKLILGFMIRCITNDE